MKPVWFFGDASHDIISLQREYFDLKFLSLRQTHSNRVVAASDVIASGGVAVEADALWTGQAGEALCIRTADCVPVLFYAPLAAAPLADAASAVIAAAHAGWRGIASDILAQTTAALRRAGADVARMQARIGPHIRVASFEVGLDVADQLAGIYAALPTQGPIVMPHEDTQKRYVNLERMAVAQLIAAGVEPSNIQGDEPDTLRDQNYHSFRRDGTKAGRQISFVAIR